MLKDGNFFRGLIVGLCMSAVLWAIIFIIFWGISWQTI